MRAYVVARLEVVRVAKATTITQTPMATRMECTFTRREELGPSTPVMPLGKVQHQKLQSNQLS